MSLSLASEAKSLLDAMGVDAAKLGGTISVTSPIDGSTIASVIEQSPDDMNKAVDATHAAFLEWRTVPAPVRGELVRLLGVELRKHKEALGKLVSIEAGKILSEGLGEVQEMIDICDFAVGQSRQLYGKTIASERPGHRMMETWHPMGVCGVISAFNFPVAVWSWNTCLALICGDSVIWKPSEKTPLSALACDAILKSVIASFEQAPTDLAQVVIGGPAVGEALVDNPLVPIISATGSTRMGKAVGPRVAARFGRSILELGWQQCHDRGPERRSGYGRARHLLLRSGHRRTALHLPAPPHRT